VSGKHDNRDVRLEHASMCVHAPSCR
jgi:hypothetical protein